MDKLIQIVFNNKLTSEIRENAATIIAYYEPTIFIKLSKKMNFPSSDYYNQITQCIEQLGELPLYN